MNDNAGQKQAAMPSAQHDQWLLDVRGSLAFDHLLSYVLEPSGKDIHSIVASYTSCNSTPSSPEIIPYCIHSQTARSVRPWVRQRSSTAHIAAALPPLRRLS
jgi:hypothetical protein